VPAATCHQWRIGISAENLVCLAARRLASYHFRASRRLAGRRAISCLAYVPLLPRRERWLRSGGIRRGVRRREKESDVSCAAGLALRRIFILFWHRSSSPLCSAHAEGIVAARTQKFGAPAAWRNSATYRDDIRLLRLIFAGVFGGILSVALGTHGGLYSSTSAFLRFIFMLAISVP